MGLRRARKVLLACVDSGRCCVGVAVADGEVNGRVVEVGEDGRA